MEQPVAVTVGADTVTALGAVVVTGAVSSVDNWPDATTTGARFAPLTSGTITTSSHGQVIERHGGSIRVEHNNVTIRDCSIFGGLYQIDLRGSHVSNTLIEHCTLDGGPFETSGGPVGVHNRKAFNTTIRNCHIIRMKRGCGGQPKGTLIEDNWITDNYSVVGAHCNAISFDGGYGIVMRGNRFEMPNVPGPSACTSLYGRSQIDDVLWDGNWFAGGSYALHGGSPGKTFPPTNVTIRNNFFRTVLYPDCGQFGPIRGTTGHAVDGNVWYDPDSIHHPHLTPI